MLQHGRQILDDYLDVILSGIGRVFGELTCHAHRLRISGDAATFLTGLVSENYEVWAIL